MQFRRKPPEHLQRSLTMQKQSIMIFSYPKSRFLLYLFLIWCKMKDLNTAHFFIQYHKWPVQFSATNHQNIIDTLLIHFVSVNSKLVMKDRPT